MTFGVVACTFTLLYHNLSPFLGIQLKENVIRRMKLGKKKIPSADKIRAYDLSITTSDALRLSYRRLVAS